jgi:hypothetical protein
MEFNKVISIQEVVVSVCGEPKEVVIGDIVYAYGNRELSATTPDGSRFVWDVNSYGDAHSYMLFDWELGEA